MVLSSVAPFLCLIVFFFLEALHARILHGLSNEVFFPGGGAARQAPLIVITVLLVESNARIYVFNLSRADHLTSRVHSLVSLQRFVEQVRAHFLVRIFHLFFEFKANDIL